MAVDNKTLETNSVTIYYALVVERDGVPKFLHKHWGWSKQADCTVKLAKARKFISPEEALKCFEDERVAERGAKLIGVATLQKTWNLTNISKGEDSNGKM